MGNKTTSHKTSQYVETEEEEEPSFPLLHLPNLVSIRLLEFLPLKDILNLRLACHATCQSIQNYNPHLLHRLSSKLIRLSNYQQLRSFLSTVQSLPFTRFHIELNPSDFHTHPDLQLFQAKFGPIIQQLTVSDMSFCVSQKEYDFYNSMKRLKTLEVLKMKLDSVTPTRDILKCPTLSRVPHAFTQTLEVLTCHKCFDSFYPYDILQACPRLKFISTGKFSFRSAILRFGTSLEVNYKEVLKVTEVLREKKISDGGHIKIHLKSLDWNWKIGSLNEQIALEFLQQIGRNDVTLPIVNAYLLDIVYENRHLVKGSVFNNILKSVKSLRGLSPSVKMLELPYLEELVFIIDSKSEIDNNCVVDKWTSSPTSCPVWQNLRKITGVLDSWKDYDEMEEVSALIRFLLESSQERVKVEELSFKINQSFLPITPEHFSVNFPNLKKLYLKNKSFDNADYSRLFLLLGQQTQIESLKLVCYVPFDDETFLGPTEDNEVPYFLTMKRLKEFSLVYKLMRRRSMNPYPSQITDKLFTHVFQAMPLKTFKISGLSLPEVTVAALEAIADGEFGRHISDFYLLLLDKSEEHQGEILRAFARICYLAAVNSNQEINTSHSERELQSKVVTR